MQEGLPREGPMGSSSVTREPQSNHKLWLLSKSLESPYGISMGGWGLRKRRFLDDSQSKLGYKLFKGRNEGGLEALLGKVTQQILADSPEGQEVQRWWQGRQTWSEKAGSQARVPGLRSCSGRDGVLGTPRWLRCLYSFPSRFPGGLVMLTWEMPCAPPPKYTQACLYPEARFQKQNITLGGNPGSLREHQGSGPTREAKLHRT